MQLILVLAVLMLLGGKSSGEPRPELSNSEMFEMLKYVTDGNAEMNEIIKQAEQVTEIINAIAPIANFAGAKEEQFTGNANPDKQDIGLILQPVAKIADDSIYNALSSAI